MARPWTSAFILFTYLITLCISATDSSPSALNPFLSPPSSGIPTPSPITIPLSPPSYPPLPTPLSPLTPPRPLPSTLCLRSPLRPSPSPPRRPAPPPHRSPDRSRPSSPLRSPPSPPRRPPSPRPLPPPPRPPPPPRTPEPETPPPQYYINFGRCQFNMQKQNYGNWVMFIPKSEQTPGSLLLYLDTHNMTAVALAFGEVQPRDFPIRHIYFAYFNKSAVKALSPALELEAYKETTSSYSIRVNDRELFTVRDLKDQGPRATYKATYSLKGSLIGTIVPSASLYKIEITKDCDTVEECAAVADPAAVFTSPKGHVAFSLWTVDQALIVNGVYVQDHAWCPVQTAVYTD